MSRSQTVPAAAFDWEGPCVKADHALSAVAKGIENGERLYQSYLSAFDDVIYLMVKKGEKNINAALTAAALDYESAGTLALAAPFLVAAGHGDEFLGRIAEEEAKYLEGIREKFRLLNSKGYPLAVISASYEQYVKPTATRVGIPLERIYSTRFAADEYRACLTEDDAKRIREAVPVILGLPPLPDVDSNTTIESLSPDARKTIEKMTEIFFSNEMPKIFHRMLREIKPVGGRRKAEAMQDYLERLGMSPKDSLVFADSVTDLDMFDYVRQNGGLAVSFNGNEKAVAHANVALMSQNCLASALICDLYRIGRHDAVQEAAANWSHRWIKGNGNLDPDIKAAFLRAYPGQVETFPEFVAVTSDNVEDVGARSSVWRKLVRGKAAAAIS